MRAIILACVLSFLSFHVVGQGEYIPPIKNRAVQKIVVDNDTILTVKLREAVITNDKPIVFYSDLDRIKYYVKKVYPYARITADIINEYDSAYAQLDRRRDRKKFMRRVEKDLKNEFQDELKDLTITQGRILIKLINRETGVTSYELIKNLKGGMSAFFWQGVAKMFGSDLKDDYDKNSEDALIEYVVRKIEKGEIYVSPRVRKTQISLENS